MNSLVEAQLNKQPIVIAQKMLGCRANAFDSDMMASLLVANGFLMTDDLSKAGVIIINTCTVTNKASADARNMIRKTVRENPQARIIVTGCYAQVSSQDVAMIDGVDLILGQNEKNEIVDYIKSLTESTAVQKINVTDISRETVKWPSVDLDSNRTRINLKIQDGCNHFCSYCIIPMARGRSVSVSLSDVATQVDQILKKKFKEIILTGIHVGAYGNDLDPRTSLTELLIKLDEKLRGTDCRLRLSSINPDEVTDELISLVAHSQNICHYFHVAIQSGSDEILRKMKRRYNAKQVSDVLRKIRKAMPDAGIGTDIIVGFPSETDELFNETMNAMATLPVTYGHVFRYSKRSGTLSASYVDDGAMNDKKKRSVMLRQLFHDKKIKFYESFINHEMNVIVEECNDNGFYYGVTSNYIPVYFKADPSAMGNVVKVRMRAVLDHAALEGEVTCRY